MDPHHWRIKGSAREAPPPGPNLSFLYIFWQNSCKIIALFRGGYRIPCRRGCQPFRATPRYDFAKFSKKLHEIEKILGCREWRALGAPPWIRHCFSVGAPSGKSWIRHRKDLFAARGAMEGGAVSTGAGEGREGARLRVPSPEFSKQGHRTGLYWGAARKQVPLSMCEHIARLEFTYIQDPCT